MKKQHLVGVALLCSIFWMACSGRKEHTEVSAADSTNAIANTDTAMRATKLVKTADMNFKVKNVKTVSDDITALTLKYKGMVMHHSTRSYISKSEQLPRGDDSVMLVSSCSTNAEMTVKIPSENIDEFLNQIGKMALYVNSRNMDIQDKTFDYLSAQMKLISRSQLVAQQKTGQVTIKNPAAVMDLKDELIDEQISNKRIDDAVKYSTVGLSFYQSNTINKEVIVNDDPADFKAPFFDRLGHSFSNGAVLFSDAIIGVANLWLFVLTLTALWVAYRYYKKRNAVAV
jgi:hypothetical protein